MPATASQPARTTSQSEGVGSSRRALTVRRVAGLLRKCPLFAPPLRLPLGKVAAITSPRSVAKGEYLFREGAVVRGFYVVIRGAIKLHRVFLSGHEQVIHIYRAGETLAEESLVSPAGHLADASAIEDTQVLLVRREDFLSLLCHQPELTLRMLQSLDRQLQRIVRLLDDLTRKDVRTRVAHWFLNRCRNPAGRAPERIVLPSTKRLLASELGTTSETFSRTLAVLREEQLLALEEDAVVLLCPSRLAASLEEGASTRGQLLPGASRPSTAGWLPADWKKALPRASAAISA